ncbi:MAG: PAS domain S-box protein [Armatimonadota bacterium]
MSDLEITDTAEGRRDGETSSHLRFIIDTAPVLISYIDRNFHYQFVNEGYAEWFGRPVVELQGRHVRDAVGAAAFDKVRHLLESALGGERVTYEAAMPYENGPARYVHTQLVPDTRGGSGSVPGIVAVVTDVSARRATERQLEESEQRYRSLFDWNVDAVFSFDLSGRFTSVNAACETISGYTPEELLTQPFLPLITPDLAPLTLRHVHRARQGESQTYETALTQKSGRRIEISVTNIPILVGGEVVGVYGIAKDITARKRRERRRQFLLQLNERTRFLSDRDRLVEETLRSVGEFLGLSRVWYSEHGTSDAEPGMPLRLDWRNRDDLSPMADTSPDSVWGAVLRNDLSAGRTLAVSDYATDSRTRGDWDAYYRRSGITASFTIPFLRGGLWAAVLSAEMYGESRAWTPEDSELLESIAQRLWVSLENLRVLHSEKENVSRQRRFLREILSSLTEGRLQLCDTSDDLPAPMTPASPALTLTAASLRGLRKDTESAAERVGMPPDRCQDLLTAVGEAGMNAVVHGGGGQARVHTDDRRGVVQVWISDNGTGISEEALPYALEIGKSSAGSLGHGFWLILKTADRVWLQTGAGGTTVVLEQERATPDPFWMKGLL